MCNSAYRLYNLYNKYTAVYFSAYNSGMGWVIASNFQGSYGAHQRLF